MGKTGIETCYVMKDGKLLRCGYTTGSCAAGAAKAAVELLLTGTAPETVSVRIPKGIELCLDIEEPQSGEGWASCAVRKYAGDDPDVTDGILIRARAQARNEKGIVVSAGDGVGRITKPGLKQPVGSAAINPVPMEMIKAAAADALKACGGNTGIGIEISVPEGKRIAARTFNPRLGIEGGISILGTSGIVEPMSDEAMIESIRLEIRQKRAAGGEWLVLTPGNIGADFLAKQYGLQETDCVKCSNFIGRALDAALEAGFTKVLLAGHAGKLIKTAGGIMNTHSREADARAEIMASAAIRAGADTDTARTVLGCVTTEEMFGILDAAGLREKTAAVIGRQIDFYLSARTREQLTVGTILFSDRYGVLYRSDAVAVWEREGGKA